MTDNLPRRPEAHDIGRAAAREFEAQIPSSWVTTESRSSGDYGWDFLVEIPAATNASATGDDFFSQVKGTASPRFVQDDSYLSYTLKTSTINWLLTKLQPVMVAVCDLSTAEKQIYYVWLADAVEDLGGRSPDWASAETATLHLPVGQMLRRDHAAIESRVRQEHVQFRIEQAIADAVLPPSRRPMPTAEVLAGATVQTFVAESVLPLIPLAAIPDGPVTGLSQQDLAVRDKLLRAAGMVKVFDDDAALGELSAVAASVENSPSRVQALYDNCLGLVALHAGHWREALSRFEQAEEKDPSEPKYATNRLVAEAVLLQDAGAPLPSDWAERLRLIRRSHPSFVPATLLEAREVGRAEGVAAAESVLRESGVLASEPGEALSTLADIAAHAGAIDEGLDYLRRLGTLHRDSDPQILSIRAYLRLRRAIPDFTAGDLVFEGTGPSSISVSMLQAAATDYRAACAGFARLGYPLVSADTFFNAATVLVLAGDADEAAAQCRNFLQQNPNEPRVNAAAAMSLIHSGQAAGAVEYARKAFSSSGNTTAFKNLLLSLLEAEEYDQVVAEVNTRESSGFADQAELSVALELEAVAYAHQGRFDKASAVIDRLREKVGETPGAIVAGAAVRRLAGEHKSRVADMLRSGLIPYPDNSYILSNLFLYLLPVTKDSAAEVVSVVTRIAGSRQLTPDEAEALGEAYTLLDQPELAEQVFSSAFERFPKDMRFCVRRAEILYGLGRDEEAFASLSLLLRHRKRSFADYRNLGFLARNTARLDVAIELFSKALLHTQNKAEEAELHCQLFELKRRRGDPPKERLRHAMRYGELISGEPEDEVRFLLMFFMTPAEQEEVTRDGEVSSWVGQFQLRLARFTAEHPRYHALQAIKAPSGLEDTEAAQYLLTEMAALTLPTRLFRGRLNMLIRGGPWPLATRAAYLGYGSVFEYWEHCTASRDAAHAIHVSGSAADFERSVSEVDVLEPVCIDLSALLTLVLLGLLEEATAVFPRIVLSSGTRDAIFEVDYFPRPVHPAAEALRTWFRQRSAKISVLRPRNSRPKDGDTAPYRRTGALWVRRTPSLEEMVGSGMGESALLCAQEKLQFWSDDVSLRSWARDEHGVKGTFCTPSLLRRLTRGGRVSVRNEAHLIARLLAANYRVPPFTAAHLHEALRDALEQANGPLNASRFVDFPTLHNLLLAFADSALDAHALQQVTAEWWDLLLADGSVATTTAAAVVATVVIRLVQRLQDSVLVGVSKTKVHLRTASLLVALLVRAFQTNAAETAKAWSILRSAAEDLYRADERGFTDLVERLMPEALFAVTRSLPSDTRLPVLVGIPASMPPSDRAKWDAVLFGRLRRQGLI